MSDSENRASPEVVEPAPDQPEVQEIPEQAPPEQVESAEPEADQPEPKDPEPSSDDKPAEVEPEGDKEAEEGAKKSEEEEAAEDKKEEGEEDKKEEDVKQEKEEEEVEEPVVITPEGNPFWLSTEEVLSKGLPDSEVENFKNFYFKHAHSLQSFHEALKDVTVPTEFLTLSKEEIEALTVEGEVSEEQQQVLNGLQDRINSVIELYEKDGALIKINGRSPKDAVLEKNDETFVGTIRDAVINFLEVEKQSSSAYSVWKDQEQQPGAFKRGMNKIRNSFRRPRTASVTGGRRKTKLEEEKKDDDAPKDEEGKEEDPKPVEDAPKEGGEAAKGGVEPVTVEVEVEVEAAGDKPDAAAKEEEPKEKAAAEATKEWEGDRKAGEEPKGEAEEPKGEAAAEREGDRKAGEEPKEEAVAEADRKAGEEPKEETKEEAGAEWEGDRKAKPDDKKEDGEIQAAEGGAEGEKKEEKKGEKVKRKSVHKKQKPAEEYQFKEAKTEPLDNRVLRAFGRVIGSYYRVEDGKGALDQLRSSVQMRKDLNKLKAFGGVEGVQVSLSVSRWLGQIPEHAGMLFRGFVYDNELTALSQHQDNIYFPNVVHYKDTIISGKVQQFFQDSIKETLKELKNYLIDFFVAPDKVYVLRLSPFYTAMGACLFTWNEDSRELTKGPFQIRVVSTPKTAPDAYSSFQPWWTDMLTSVLNQRKESENRPPPSRMGCVIL